MNGQSLNFENISRESHTSRTTVQTYFEVLIETLIGFYLPAYQPGLKVKELAKPKFYFFDTGVARSCAGLISYSLDSAYKGFLFETFMINQIKAYNEYSNKHLNLYYYAISGVCRHLMGIEKIQQQTTLWGHFFEQFILMELRSFISYKQKRKQIYFWRTVNKQEVDFIIEDVCGVEVKSTAKITKSHCSGLLALKEENKIKKFFLVSEDPIERMEFDIEIIHWKTFLEKLWSDEIF